MAESRDESLRQDGPIAARLREASAVMRDAGALEKTDLARSAARYREAILLLLESSDDPLESESVRRDLVRGFDRLSLVLKRAGLAEEALEEADCAASLCLLDESGGAARQRAALVKRRDSLRRSLAATASEASG